MKPALHRRREAPGHTGDEKRRDMPATRSAGPIGAMKPPEIEKPAV
ncbi:MAG: hypothetical protein KIT84_22160 [Labilithrix sp.]|nr:hypothetical protein [Labilithrix sp.]MCW5813750.1 hypothetical protein [Labilithrix sp.]